MDEAQKDLTQSSEIKNILPDVVHSQQISSSDAVVERNTNSEADTTQQTEESQGNDIQDVEDVSATESISEHIPFKGEYSITESEAGQSLTQHGLLRVEPNSEQVSKNSSLNIPLSHQKNIISPNPQDTSHHSASWNVDANQSDVHISEESPVILALSSDTSKELLKTKSQSSISSNHEIEESPRSEYIDSLNDNSSHQSLHGKENDDNFKEKSDLSMGKGPDSIEQCSSESEEVIKLDIRGQAAPKFPFQAAKIFFGPPPDGSTIVGPNLEPLPVFQTLLSPCLVGANDGVTVEEVFEEKSESNVKEGSPEKSLSPSVCSGSDKMEQDVLVEEMTVEDEMKEKNYEGTTPPKSFAPEDMSFNTMSTDYKTICEEYHAKLVHFEEALAHRDQLIEELTLSLQRAVRERDGLKHENEHLASEVQSLQHVIAERSNSDHDTIKAQLSDYVKYQTMLKEDSTKFYSALMSGTTSLQSSNGEKDMDRDEITVNHSKSDLRSTGSSDEFQTGFEDKLTSLLNTFEGYIEESLRNKLRESLIQVLCDEIGKMRVEYDTDLKELESQMKQEKQIYTKETRKLRELLSSVKAGNADIGELRKELSIKHEKEMENLRTYFEKKCSDMERSYSEEVWRGRAASPPPPPPEPAAGDARRRTRSVDLTAWSLEACSTSTPIENTLKQTNKKLEQQLEDLKSEHITYINELQARHKEAIADLEEQITQLKAHIQTAENTEGNMSCLYQQDIDLELEKVLLSDPDAELSSWPLELVALRDRIHAEKPSDNESVRDEVSAGDADKWRRRRNCSFDQNRQLEEVTKERDGFKRVALSLQRAVAQLVAYCASAEHELNTTVLARLLADHDQSLELSSRPSSPQREVRHVHFAPRLGALAAPDADAALAFLQQQRDLGAHVRRELEQSLRRLRDEAHGLLDLAARRADTQGRQESIMLEASSDTLPAPEELELDACRNCQMLKMEMETALSECAEREALLRAEAEAAALRVAQLLADAPHSDVIAEGYGTAATAVTAGAGVSAACRSLDDASPRTQLGSLARELDAALRDRDDARLQLEAANRQLRSTRQFVEEQAAEREAERDDFAARLQDLRDDNARLAARLATSARILAEVRGVRARGRRQNHAHVEQLEAQARDMNQIITELETRKAAADDELKAAEEKITLLRDIIASLESQLEQKTAREVEVLEQLEEMKRTIEERDSKMRALLGELEALRGEREGAACARCAGAGARYQRLVDNVKRQALRLERRVARRARRLERAHECGSASGSERTERTEDVSLRDTRLEAQCESGSGSGSSSGSEGAWSEGSEGGSGAEGAGEALARVRARLAAAARAEDAALKRIADLEMQRKQLADVAQEVRAERDVLQARMSEQALRVSSLAARLQRQRNDAHALAHAAASDLGVRLHDAHAEVQRLKEELEVKDKQLSRLKQSLEERDKNGDQQLPLYSDSCNPADRVSQLERALAAERARAARLQARLDDVMALKLEDEQNQKSEIIENKTSARTLSDIVSISDYDEQDMQMRRAELKSQNNSLTHEFKDRTNPNKTLPPEVPRPSLSLPLEDAAADALSPRADSLPAHLTSTQNRDTYKRNANEMTLFGTIDKFGDNFKHSTAQDIQDNCSMYPNRDVSDGKDISVEPKKIDFSLEQSDNRTQDDEFTSLRELGIMLDVKQENFPDILTQLKHEIKKARNELEACKSELKNAEEQLCEFPALKEEVEELKGLLENTMATMENDKKFYENQLESFSSNKKLLEQRLSELSEDAAEKAKDLHLLKEDILRRENMILELAKEKRNLTNKITELESKISELQSRNTSLEKCEMENKQLRDKVNELKKLEQLVSEKNQQIDSLNQHLDRLDDLQRCLNDKTEEMENLKEALDEKSNELFQMQDSVATLNRDIAKVIEENDQLSYENKDLKQKLTKIEKEQENASLKLQNSESEIERLNSLNNDLTSRIDELKELNVKLKDKETEIEILNEDINSYHNEVALLKEQLKMESRSPSPRSKGEERRSPAARPASDDKKQLVRIKKQISLLQHELDFQKKELNDKAFELAKAKLDATEARAAAAQLAASERERARLQDQLAAVSARLREESNISELKEKLRDKVEKCQELEAELANMREIVERMQQPAAAAEERARSPTAELERALRDQLDYSHALDEDIMDQILSASSDERDDIPMLALNSSNRSCSSSASSPARARRLRADCERLQLQLGHLQARLGDKDALIAELTRVREAAEAEAAAARLRLQAERDHAARLALLLDAHKDSADTLHNQDSNMIELLKRRLEGAMRSEQEAQEREQALLRRAAALERALPPAASAPHDDLLRQEKESNALLRARLEREARRGAELQAALEAARAQARRDADAHAQRAADLRAELADLRRLKHEAGVELARTKELLHTQSATIIQLEKKLNADRNKNDDSFTEIEKEKWSLAREMATLRRCLGDAPELLRLRRDLADKDQAIRFLHGRWARLESCRKALVWQKRFLQRQLAGYAALERRLRPGAAPDDRSAGLRRFRCVAWAAVATLRMGFLVRRREAARAAAASALLVPAPTPKPAHEYEHEHEHRASPQPTPTPSARPLLFTTPQSGTPVARRVLRRDLRLALPASPTPIPTPTSTPKHVHALSDSIRRLPLEVNSPLEEPFKLRSPRAHAAACLQRLDAAGRRLRGAD